MTGRTLSLVAVAALMITACGQLSSEYPLRVEAAAMSTPEGTRPVVSAQPTVVIPIEPAAPSPTVPLTPPPDLILPTPTPYPESQRFSLGRSVEGRDIWAWQFGGGPSRIILVGGIHGGFEANTVALAEQLIDYFRRSPVEVLPGIRLVIIPSANPDGLVRGSEIEGRFNARGVDLNRNWGCEWSGSAVLRDIQVDPGPRPFSEPETLALRMYFIADPPDAVIFYHSAAGGVFLGQCGGQPPARWLGELLEEATGYPHLTFDYYEVSGDATNWLAERGIPAAVIETYTKEESDFDINLAGVMALQCHFVQQELGADDDVWSDPGVRRWCQQR